MATRTITGNLAADPIQEQAGRATVTKFRVIENTGQLRKSEWVEDPTPTTHFVEAWFDLGENIADTLKRGTSVIVVGEEHTESWGPDDARQYGRVLRAAHVGPDLRTQVAQISKVAADNPGE